ncbi:acyltransferase [Aeromicrobium sp.]
MDRTSWQREWWRKKRWYGRGLRPLARIALTRELGKRRAYARGVMYGEVLEMLREGRLTIGEQAFFENGVWLTGTGHLSIGAGAYLNLGVMVAVLDRVEIGDHCMIANGSLITDANHRYDDLTKPLTWQGFESKGPTIIGDNCWLGANVVVTSGVTIGERCVIGANAVVTRDIPPHSVAAGNPARVIRTITDER